MRAFAIVVVLAVGRVAHADCICHLFAHLFERPDGEAWLHYELTGLDRIDGDNRVERDVLAGFRLGAAGLHRDLERECGERDHRSDHRPARL